MAETKVDIEKLRDVSKRIGALMDDYQKTFTALAGHTPNAGKFDAAVWLEDLFVDRRDAVVVHAKYLRVTFEEINEGLLKIADAFEGVDLANAQAVAAATKQSKEAITEMGKSEFEVPKVKQKESYETDDKKVTGDKLTVGFANGDKDNNTLKFDPSTIPGMNEFMTLNDLGHSDELDLNLRDAPGVHDEDGYSAPQTEMKDPPKAPDTTEPGKPDPQDDDKPAPAGEAFNPKHQPEGQAAGSEKYRNQTFSYYNVNGQQQTDSDGTKIWWKDGQPYYKSGDRFYLWKM